MASLADSNPSKWPNGGCRPESNSTHCRYCGAHPIYQSVTSCPSRPPGSNPSKRPDDKAKPQYYPEDEIQAESMGLKLRPDDMERRIFRIAEGHSFPPGWRLVQYLGEETGLHHGPPFYRADVVLLEREKSR